MASLATTPVQQIALLPYAWLLRKLLYKRGQGKIFWGRQLNVHVMINLNSREYKKFSQSSLRLRVHATRAR